MTTTTHQPTIIVLASEKGGVSKTGVSAHLAHGLACAGHPTLLIDSDPQGNLAIALGQQPGNNLSQYLIGHPAKTILARPNLFLLPGNQATTRSAEFIKSAIGAGDTDPNHIQNCYLDLAAQLNAPYIVIDTQPTPNWWVEQQYLAAHIAIIPTGMDTIEISAINTTKAKFDHLNPGCLTRILPSIYYSGRSLDAENLALLQATYGDILLDPIPAAADVRSARSFGQTIFEYKPRHPAAAAYWRTINHILALTGGCPLGALHQPEPATGK